MFNKKTTAALILTPAFFISSNAYAQKSSDEGRPMLLENLVNCSAIQNDNERLICFDKNIGAFQTAEVKGDIIVEERVVIERSREEVFGLSSVDNPVFNGKNEANLQKIESKITFAQKGSTGRWLFILENGSTWRQADISRFRTPNDGDTIVIEKASFGGFKAFVGKQRSIRVKRIR